MSNYINFSNLTKALINFNAQKPFPYAIVDNFFKKSIAKKLEKEFLLLNNLKDISQIHPILV